MKNHHIHLKAPDNWINDPNGFIYYKGSYHLFYQYFPFGPRWGTMHWGHAVSRDLVNWEHQGIALYPTVRGDRNGCFSGSAIEEEGTLHLFYTGVRYEVVNPEDPHTCLNEQFEACQLRISSEDGFHFDNEQGKEVIIPPVTDPEIGDRTHTRDPKIWRGKDAWYLVLGSTMGEKYGEVLFYRSEDLHTWTYVNKSWKGSDYGWMWECPDYFSTEGGDVLLVSAMGLLKEGKEKNQSICFPVTFTEETCTMEIPDVYQYLDYGLDLYAPQTTLDEEGRRIMVAWARMPEVTKQGWIGMFCSPRVVENHKGHIYFRMHPRIRKAFTKEIGNVKEARDKKYLAVLELREGESVEIGGFLISRNNGKIVTDRTAVYPRFEGAHIRCETPEIKEGDQLEILVDENMIEVFVNQGEYVITNVVYDLKDTITCHGNVDVKLFTVETYEVTALGELLVDFTENGSSDQNNPVFEANPGGAPCNVLAMLSKLGHKTAFIGKVGQDSFGRRLKEEVIQAGINGEYLTYDPDTPTTLAFVHTLENGDRDFSFYRNPGADRMLTEEEVPEERIRNSRIFHFGTVSMTHDPARKATKKAVEIAEKNHCIRSFDPNLRLPLWDDPNQAREQILWGLAHCDILKISDDEVLWLTGKEDTEGIHWILEHFSIPLILLSRGRKGSRAYYKGTVTEAEAFLNENTIETTGAGDTFMGCILSRVLELGLDHLTGEDLSQMLRFANAGASLITTKKGALKVMPEKEEILSLILSEEGER